MMPHLKMDRRTRIRGHFGFRLRRLEEKRHYVLDKLIGPWSAKGCDGMTPSTASRLRDPAKKGWHSCRRQREIDPATGPVIREIMSRFSNTLPTTTKIHNLRPPPLNRGQAAPGMAHHPPPPPRPQAS